MFYVEKYEPEVVNVLKMVKIGALFILKTRKKLGK